jgi:hypothetical protein
MFAIRSGCGRKIQASPVGSQPDKRDRLQEVHESQTAPWREVQRARVLWRYSSGENVAEIARAVKMTRKSVTKWIAKALDMGVTAALKDTYHRPRAPVITIAVDGKPGVQAVGSYGS